MEKMVKLFAYGAAICELIFLTGVIGGGLIICLKALLAGG